MFKLQVSKIKDQLRIATRDYFLAGVLLLAPMLIVLEVFQWVFGGLVIWIDEVPLQFILGDDNQMGGPLRAVFIFAGLVIGYGLICAVGFISRLYIGKKLVSLLSELLQKVPIFGAIYSSLDQLAKSVSPSGGKQFSRVVLIEYPRKDVWAVAFVTGELKIKALPAGYLNVYVPTVPNPTSGFHLMIPESDVRESGLKVDEAFRMILSLGIAQPKSEGTT